MSLTIEKIVEDVLIQNKIRNYDKKDLELQLQIHPNYPSFQSITDTLDYFNINNIAVEIPKEALDQLPDSFISLVKIGQAEEIVPVSKQKDSVEIKHDNIKQKKYTFNEFNEIWNPKIIAVEADETQERVSNRSLIHSITYILLTIGVLAIGFTRSWDLYSALFLLFSVAGLVFSFFALRESLGMKSEKVHQFCTTIGNTNCGDVINNNSGKLLKNFSLADAGIVFFSTMIIYQIFFGFTNALFIPAVIGIPFVLYSFYSQALVIKKWCALCISMGVLSLFLGAIAIKSLSFSLGTNDINGFVQMVTIASLIILGYLFTKEKTIGYEKLKAESLKLNQFKRDEQIFGYLLNTSKKIDDVITVDNEIILGSPNATFKITSLTNPMCGYCKGAFEAYMRVLKTMGDRLQIIIRLNVNPNDPDNQATKIALSLMSIYKNKGADAFIKAYSEWFADRTFSKWIKKYGINENNAEHIEILQKQVNWAKQNEVTYTPATLLGNTLYPQKYSYDEFFHFVGVLLENEHNS